MVATKTPRALKGSSAAECHTLEQLPNIGPALAADLAQRKALFGQV